MAKDNVVSLEQPSGKSATGWVIELLLREGATLDCPRRP